MQIENDLKDSRQYGFQVGPISNWDDNWDITSGKLLVISLNNNFRNCGLNSTKSAFVYLKYGAIIHLSQWQKTKVSSITEGKTQFHISP